ncbi:hypothetical protein CDAR_11591 [Caerostris darwini]|uniref:Uncharacterized protein n=1 Tax=Caerostris darwini TaxID=1538125 RepID=A0AAV4REJ5_9ARAC|nr:hypothetical protein CDAR_11591 [Caerostris darwini]
MLGRGGSRMGKALPSKVGIFGKRSTWDGISKKCMPRNALPRCGGERRFQSISGMHWRDLFISDAQSTNAFENSGLLKNILRFVASEHVREILKEFPSFVHLTHTT